MAAYVSLHADRRAEPGSRLKRHASASSQKHHCGLDFVTAVAKPKYAVDMTTLRPTVYRTAAAATLERFFQRTEGRGAVHFSTLASHSCAGVQITLNQRAISSAVGGLRSRTPRTVACVR